MAPLSKKRNRNRMRGIRLKKRLLSPQKSNSVQPEPVNPSMSPEYRRSVIHIDADGNPYYEE